MALALGCGTGPTVASAPPALFSGTQARGLVQRWMEFPRSLGHPGRSRSIAQLATTLRTLGAERVEGLTHRATDPFAGPGQPSSYELTEVLGSFRPSAPRHFVLATHFDTRAWADEEPDATLHHQPVPGANDGTSGLAVILAAIPVLLRELPGDVGFVIILFDGEELGHPDHPGYCAGSRWLAGQIEAGEHASLAAAEFGIVVDMVGDGDLHVEPEPNSLAFNPDLTQLVWATAADLGITQFSSSIRASPILDDHVWLSAAGIPSVLVIDREYDAWHRLGDRIERVSAHSLGAVGEVVVRSVLRYFETRRVLPLIRRAGTATWQLRPLHAGRGADRAPPAHRAGRPGSGPPVAVDAGPAD